jgi:hypothetical protein
VIAAFTATPEPVAIGDSAAFTVVLPENTALVEYSNVTAVEYELVLTTAVKLAEVRVIPLALTDATVGVLA